MTRILPEEILCILFGTSIYEDERLPRLPAARTNLQEMERILRKEVGVPDDNILAFYDKAVRYQGLAYTEIENQLLKPKINPDDSKIKYILFYYSGHGVRGNGDEDYYLCLSSTILGQEQDTALDVKRVCETLSKYNKKLFVVIDACFSQNITVSLAAGKDDYYAMTSSSFDEVTKYPVGDYHSAFTDRFVKIIDKGLPGSQLPWLSFDEIFMGVHTWLVKDKFPEPKAHGNPLIGDYAIYPNKAYGREEAFTISKSIFAAALARYDRTIAEEVDPDILGRYPLFISHFLKDIFQKDNPSTGDRNFFLLIYMRIVKFLSFVIIKTLPDACQQLEEDREVFNKWKSFPTHQEYYDILLRGCKFCCNVTIPELVGDAPFIKTIQTIQRKLDEIEPVTLADLRQDVIMLLKQMAFLCQYNLLAVRFIMVKKGYFLPIIYQHETSDLFGFNSKDYRFSRFPIYIHNGAVILYKKSITNIPEENRYVNLWPLVIDANGTDPDSQKPNIQFYSGTEEECRFYYEDCMAKKKEMQDITKEYDEFLNFPPHWEWEEYFKKF